MLTALSCFWQLGSQADTEKSSQVMPSCCVAIVGGIKMGGCNWKVGLAGTWKPGMPRSQWQPTFYPTGLPWDCILLWDLAWKKLKLCGNWSSCFVLQNKCGNLEALVLVGCCHESVIGALPPSTQMIVERLDRKSFPKGLTYIFWFHQKVLGNTTFGNVVPLHFPSGDTKGRPKKHLIHAPG